MKSSVVRSVFTCALAWPLFCAEEKISYRERDLSEMFYSDTLIAKPSLARSKQSRPRKTSTAPAHTGAATNKSAPVSDSHPPATGSNALRRTGLKYRLYLAQGCNMQEVDDGRVFRFGDAVRFQFESNVNGYLYVVQKGSSGRESTLFPHQDINGGDNRIARGIAYTVPSTGWFTFDEIQGEEQMTVIVSREPIQSIPPETPQQRPRQSVSLAYLFSELDKRVRPRDLMFYKETAPAVAGSTAETQATVVVNTASDANDAVYINIRLKHQ